MLTKNIPHLDGWRGLAIVLVLLCHFGDRTYAWIGEFGVMLFFVLSGLLMSQLLFIRKVEIPDFFARRASRILPTFWVYLAAVLAYSYLIQPSPYRVGLKEFLLTASFLRTYLPSDLSIWSQQWAIGHVWSLNVEEHSYIFLAAGALIFRGFKFRIASLIFLIASAVTVLALNFYYATNPPQGASPWFLRSEVASLGLLSAAALRVARDQIQIDWSKRVFALLPVLTFLVALACFSTYQHKGVDKTIAPLCLAFTIVFIDRVPDIFRRLLSGRVLRHFGLAAFSLYLWQQPFFDARMNSGFHPLLGGFLAVIIGFASYHFLENPMRHRFNEMWSARKARQLTAEIPAVP